MKHQTTQSAGSTPLRPFHGLDRLRALLSGRFGSLAKTAFLSLAILGVASASTGCLFVHDHDRDHDHYRDHDHEHDHEHWDHDHWEHDHD